MIERRWQWYFALSSLAILPAALVAQPMPLPPPGFPDYVNLLSRAYNDRDLKAYGDLFREDVKVYSDGVPIASDRAAFLVRIESEFQRNLRVRPLSWAQGSQILVMEEIDGCVPSQPDPHTVYHVCSEARSIRYGLADDYRIKDVHILEADRAWNMHVEPK